MVKKIFVGSLPFSVTDDQLRNLFAEYGTVESAKVITDRYTGKSRGFGFIEMSSIDETQQAIQALDGNELEGRNIVVNEANPPKTRNDDGGRNRRRW